MLSHNNRQRAWLALCLSAPLFAQQPVRPDNPGARDSGTVTLSVIGATQTQALIKVQGVGGDCIIAADPPIIDLDPFRYRGANTCAGRPDTIAWSDGTKILTIGHQIGNRALQAGASYRLSVDGTSIAFTTALIPKGYTQAFPIPVDRSVFGNRGNQSSVADVLARLPFADALTGAVLTPASGFLDWTFRYPGWNTANTTGDGAQPFAHWDGGLNWSNPGSITAGAKSKAGTDNSNPLDLYLGVTNTDLDRAWYITTLVDFAVRTWGSGAHANVCIFANPVDGCIASGFQIDLTRSSGMRYVPSLSADPDHPWPSQFPQALFAGWGKDVVIRATDRLTWGTLSAASGVVTLDGNVTDTNNISPTVKRGAKMYIAGAHALNPPCANDMCTVDHVISANKVALVEQITAKSGTAYEMMGFGVRIWNADPGRAMQIGVEWRAAGTRNLGVSDAGNAKCAQGPGFVSGDNPPKQMKVCSVPQNGIDLFYLLADDGTARVFHSAADMPPLSYFTGALGWPEGEAPAANVGGWCCNQMRYFPKDARSWYVYAANRGGGASLWEVRYMGDATENRDWQYQLMVGGDAYPQYGVEGQLFDKQKWSIVLGSGDNLVAKIKNKYPDYDDAFYGTSFQFQGVSGRAAYFLNQYSGMPQDGPSLIAVQDLTTKDVTLISSMKGSQNSGSPNLWGGWGGVHNLTALSDLPDSMSLSTHSMMQGNSSIKFGGPFQVTPDAVLRGGAWSNNTCLSWPVGDGRGCPGVPPPDDDCSVLAPNNPFQFAGATGHNCVAVRVPHGGVCNLSPHPAELAHPGWACPWNPAYSRPFDVKVGDQFMEAGNTNHGIWGETFRLLAISSGTETKGEDKWVWQRNSTSDYECVAPGPVPGSRCVMSPNQNWHPDKWPAIVMSGGINGWQQGLYLITGSSGFTIQASSGLAAAGHSGATQVSPSMYVVASSAGATVPKPLAHIFDIPVQEYGFSTPQFHGKALPIGNNSIQSYFVPVPDSPTGVDYNTLNNNGGWAHTPIGGGRDLIPTDTPDIYKIELIGDDSDLKSFFVHGWAGYWLLEDVSGPELPATGPASNLNRPDTQCVPLRDGECYAGSSARAAGSHGHRFGYVHVPAAYDPDKTCHADTPYLKIPCLMVGWPGIGAVREQGIIAADPNGVNTRILSYLQDIPGQQRPYATAEPFSAAAIWGPPTRVQGMINTQWIISRPQWADNTPVASDFLGVPFLIAPGPKYARVVFGYSRFGDKEHLRCSTRAEACNSTGAPFNWESEQPVNLLDCTNGCTLSVSVMAPNIVYAKVQRSNDGVNWSNQDGNVLAIAVSGMPDQ
jgi:hypothetical protein